jgi:hypothetical protein
LITIEKSKNYKLIRDILTDPVIFKVCGLGDDIKKFKVDKSYNYLIVKQDKVVIGCYRLLALTSTTLKCHIQILPKYWGIPGLSDQCCVVAQNWIRENTKFNKCFTDVPVDCVHVHEMCKRINWKPCGLIREGCFYNGKLTDLILYDYSLRENNNG